MGCCIFRRLQIHAGCLHLWYKMSYHRLSSDSDAPVVDACGFQNHSNTTDNAHIDLKLKRCSLSVKQNIVCIMPETTSTCRVYTTRPRVKCLLLHVTLQVSSTASSSVDNNTNIIFPFGVDCQAPSRQTVLINSPSCLRSPIRISTKSAHIEKLELATAKRI